MIHVAIVGSGPTGCFIAEFLAKKHADIQVDIFERLPTPYGLVRAGVAPDHQQTKNIAVQLERTLQRDNVRFIGNIEIGTTIPYQALKDNYHAVVIASGAFSDRPLPGLTSETAGIYGSARLAGWYNSHPDYCTQPPVINGDSVAIIGNGNVALDIARVFARTETELHRSDINPEALETIRNANIRHIYIIGRRGLENASFTNMELTELVNLDSCTVTTAPDRLPETIPSSLDAGQQRALEQNLQTLLTAATGNSDDHRVQLHLLFNYQLESLSYDGDHLSGITLTDTTASAASEQLAVQTLISAIGYTSTPINGIPFDHEQGRFKHQDGVIEPGVYCAGWCKRGPQGVIPTNRSDANGTGKRILADLLQSEIQKPGFDALTDLLKSVSTTSFRDWQRIDQAEQARADHGAPRIKFTDREAMLKQIN